MHDCLLCRPCNRADSTSSTCSNYLLPSPQPTLLIAQAYNLLSSATMVSCMGCLPAAPFLHVSFLLFLLRCTKSLAFLLLPTCSSLSSHARPLPYAPVSTPRRQFQSPKERKVMNESENHSRSFFQPVFLLQQLASITAPHAAISSTQLSLVASCLFKPIPTSPKQTPLAWQDISLCKPHPTATLLPSSGHDLLTTSA